MTPERIMTLLFYFFSVHLLTDESRRTTQNESYSGEFLEERMYLMMTPCTSKLSEGPMQVSHPKLFQSLESQWDSAHGPQTLGDLAAGWSQLQEDPCSMSTFCQACVPHQSWDEKAVIRCLLLRPPLRWVKSGCARRLGKSNDVRSKVSCLHCREEGRDSKTKAVPRPFASSWWLMWFNPAGR